MSKENETDEDVSMLVCPLASFRRPAVPSTGRKCHDCKRVVWVSLLMAPSVDSGELDALCRGCVHDRQQRHNDVVWGVHPVQLEDAKNDPARLARLEETAQRHRDAFWHRRSTN